MAGKFARADCRCRTYVDRCRRLSLTLAAIWFASRPATAKKTFGYYRLEILAAFINGIALVLISLWVIYEAFERWQTPPEIRGFGMTVIAVGGLIVNIVCAYLLHGEHEHDLNMRGAWLHIMGDLLGSVVAIVGGRLILAFGWTWTDAASQLFDKFADYNFRRVEFD